MRDALCVICRKRRRRAVLVVAWAHPPLQTVGRLRLCHPCAQELRLGVVRSGVFEVRPQGRALEYRALEALDPEPEPEQYAF